MEVFSRIVEKVKKLPLNEKVKLSYLLKKDLIRDRRSKILLNLEESKKECKLPGRKFSNSISTLKKTLETH